MPRWLLPGFAAAFTLAVSIEGLSALLHSVGVPAAHHLSYFDAYGEYREGGSTRAGFLINLLSIGAAIWAACAVSRRRLDAGMTSADRRKLGCVMLALLSYTLILTLMTTMFERQTHDVPDLLFGLIDLAILVGCGWAAYRLHERVTPT